MKKPLKVLEIDRLKNDSLGKITAMGERRKKKVRVALAHLRSDSRRTSNTMAESLSDEFGTYRDWKRVVITENTDARGRASLFLLRNIFGDDALVYRDVGVDCCSECCRLFGNRGSPKNFRLRDVSDDIVGAVHPNCNCEAWKSSVHPELVKATQEAEVLGMVIKRREGGRERAYVSAWGGYWVPMDSITGRVIIQLLVGAMPLILQREQDGYGVFTHGHAGKSKQTVLDIYPLSAFDSARFYQTDHGGQNSWDNRIITTNSIRTRDDYISHIKMVLPQIALMPEYWDRGQKIRWLTDFLGFKTLSDWIIVVPGKVNQNKRIGRLPLAHLKRDLRRKLYESLDQSNLAKGFDNANTIESTFLASWNNKEEKRRSL